MVTRGDREMVCSEAELRDMASAGLLQRGDLVYHPILGRWLYAREVEEVREEMQCALTLGQRPAPLSPAEPVNGEAVAGFVLGMLGHVPLLGLAFCLLGIYFSERGLKRAGEMGQRGHGLAIAGMVLSLAFLVPAAACDALFLAAMGPLV
jgi:hypothetical protein